MGKDYVHVKQNGRALADVFAALQRFAIIEASSLDLFSIPPQLYEIQEIELGTDGTEESIVRLKDGKRQRGGFVVYDGTLPLPA